MIVRLGDTLGGGSEVESVVVLGSLVTSGWTVTDSGRRAVVGEVWVSNAKCIMKEEESLWTIEGEEGRNIALPRAREARWMEGCEARQCESVHWSRLSRQQRHWIHLV